MHPLQDTVDATLHTGLETGHECSAQPAGSTCAGKCTDGSPRAGERRIHITEEFKRAVLQLLDPRHFQQTRTPVARGTAAKSHDKMPAPLAVGSHDEFAHTPAGGQNRIPFF